MLSELPAPPELFMKIAELHAARGHPPLNQMPSPHFEQVDDRFSYRINGSGKPVTSDGATIPPFSAIIFHQDFPIAIVDPAGGGCIGNAEDDLIDALEAAIGLAGKD